MNVFYFLATICVWHSRWYCDMIRYDVMVLLLLLFLLFLSSSYHFPQIAFSHASAPFYLCLVSTMPSFIHIAWLYFLILFLSAIFPLQSHFLLYSRKSGKQIKFANRMLFSPSLSLSQSSLRPTHYLSPNKNEMKSSEQISGEKKIERRAETGNILK